MFVQVPHWDWQFLDRFPSQIKLWTVWEKLAICTRLLFLRVESGVTDGRRSRVGSEIGWQINDGFYLSAWFQFSDLNFFLFFSGGFWPSFSTGREITRCWPADIELRTCGYESCETTASPTSRSQFDRLQIGWMKICISVHGWTTSVTAPWKHLTDARLTHTNKKSQ